MTVNADDGWGNRAGITGTFTTLRATRGQREQVWNLQVEHEGEMVSVLLPPTRSDVRFDLLTGREYVFADVRKCKQSSAEPMEVACPACDGALREWRAVDDYPAVRVALAEFETCETFYVVDTATSIQCTTLPERELVAGTNVWRPWRAAHPPDGVVCVDCHREYGAPTTPPSGTGHQSFTPHAWAGDCNVDQSPTAEESTRQPSKPHEQIEDWNSSEDSTGGR